MKQQSIVVNNSMMMKQAKQEEGLGDTEEGECTPDEEEKGLIESPEISLRAKISHY